MSKRVLTYTIEQQPEGEWHVLCDGKHVATMPNAEAAMAFVERMRDEG